ncbi:hypothetical protein Leryth_022800 [Lithospermum erythrorhizon]|nr:hypothetical protein Leryth_022800 [Lithospermum erythrorhizon]
MNLESGWLIAASFSWRLLRSGRGLLSYPSPESWDIKSGKVSVGFDSSLSYRLTWFVQFRNKKDPLGKTGLASSLGLEGISSTSLYSMEERTRKGLLFSRRPSYTHVSARRLLGLEGSQADTYDRAKERLYFSAPGERKFDRGLRGEERWKKRLDGFQSLCASRMR